MLLISTLSIKAQFIVTPSTPITNYAQPEWSSDVDMNDKYTAMVYGNQSTPIYNGPNNVSASGVWLKVFNQNNSSVTADIKVFNIGMLVSKVKINKNNEIFILGHDYINPQNKFLLKKYNVNGILQSTKLIWNGNIGYYDLEVADNNDVLVSIFTSKGQNYPADLSVFSFDNNLNPKGTLQIATNIYHSHLPTSNLRSHFMDYNNGSFIVGYSSGVGSNITATIKKYNYNTSNISSSANSNNYTFTGGMKRFSYANNSSHQVALRSNGDIFYVNANSGIYRLTGTTHTKISSNKDAKIIVDKSDNLLITWVDINSAKARLYSNTNSFIHSYQEGGNLNGQWDAAMYDCKFVIVGDKSNLATDFHTYRKPHYQFFNCSSCTPNGIATAAASFRYPNEVHEVNSKFGPLKVTELCLIDDLLVDGSASCNETGYFVGLAEFDPITWTDVQLLHSGWVSTTTQAPNNINIVSFLPTGYHLRPGKIYRFRLAVANPWDSVDIFFEVSCCKRKPIILDPDHEVAIAVKEREAGKELENNDDQVVIYPNPVKDTFTITLDEILTQEKEVTVKIYNNLGIEIYNKNTDDQQLIVDSSRWTSGYYICKIFLSAETITKKLIKE